MDNLKLAAKMGRYLGDFQKWGKITMRDLAMRFQNPLLRQAGRCFGLWISPHYLSL